MAGKTESNFLYHLVALVTVVIWGSTFVFTKLLLLSGLSPVQIFTFRFLIAYVLLVAFSFCQGRRFRWLSNSWKDEGLMLALGVTGGSLYFLTENEALNYTTTTNTSLIVCSCPLVAALLISLFYKSQRLRKMQALGSLIAVVGVAVVVLNGCLVLHLSPVGDALALAANYQSYRYGGLRLVVVVRANHPVLCRRFSINTDGYVFG
jgi:drug/metabolite transporter (DMT)-like permease